MHNKSNSNCDLATVAKGPFRVIVAKMPFDTALEYATEKPIIDEMKDGKMSLLFVACYGNGSSINGL